MIRRPRRTCSTLARGLRMPLVGLVTFSLLGAGSCGLEPDENVGGSARDAELQAIVVQVAEAFYAPGYRLFATTAAALPPAAATFCADRSQPNLDALRLAWRAAMTDWQRVQPALTFGPVEAVERQIQLYPGGQIPASELVAGAVDDYLAGSEAVDAETLATRTVAVQGLSALEYLLYEPDGSVLAEFPATAAGDRRCAMVEGISENLERLADEPADAWEQDWVDLFVTAELGNAQFDDRRDATSEVLNGILQLLERISDDKLQSTLGADAATARPNRLEAARSRTSLQQIHTNLQAIRTIYLGSESASMSAFLADDIRTESTDAAVREALDAALAATGAISLPLVDAIANTEERVWIEALLDRLGDLRTLFEEEVSVALESRTIFNSTDGD